MFECDCNSDREKGELRDVSGQRFWPAATGTSVLEMKREDEELEGRMARRGMQRLLLSMDDAEVCT